MAEFTPGPWEWSTSNSWRRLSAGGNDGNVMYPCLDSSDNHPNLEFPNGGFMGPDANLIMAAPDMYVGCRMLIEAEDDLDGEDSFETGAGYTSKLDSAIALIRIALAKAEGKSNG